MQTDKSEECREVRHLLLIQDICLSWSKKERNSACAKKRTEFPVAYSSNKMSNVFHGEILVNRLSFLQNRTVFQTLNGIANGFQSYPSVKDLNLTNLYIQSVTYGYKVVFFYDERRSGQPIRRGHNKDYDNADSLLYHHDILNETAFSLKQGQYGRIIWNERKTDWDTGEWYYQLHILNLLYSDKIPEADIFLTGKLDFEYKQIAVLY